MTLPTVSSQDPEISIVVPVYRNADMLKELYRRLHYVLESLSLPCEILFVDDACPADSLAILKALSQGDSRVAVLALERNIGQQRAILMGLNHARGRYLVVMDADLQDPPEAISDLLAKLQEGFAAVFAGRRGRYESPARLLTSRIFKHLLHLMCGVPADAGMFVAMNRQMVERLLAYREPRPFVLAMIGCTGLPLASIPVVRSQRARGRSGYSLWGRLKTALLALALVPFWKWRPRPLSAGNWVDQAAVRAYIGARFASMKEPPS